MPCHEIDIVLNSLTAGLSAREYQRRVASVLEEGKHVDLWAPTGSGKTLTALAPFLAELLGGGARWDRLIYVLPLRTLVESIAAEAERIMEAVGLDPRDVRVQTGERPDDPFFSEGKVIVTTYDQLLSGALGGPYGLPGKLHNINVAAVAGALIVFDEFHLMEPDVAFLTAVAHLSQYRSLCQSIWMTATATSPLRSAIRKALHAEPIDVSPAELATMPAVVDVERQFTLMGQPLNADVVLASHAGRTIVLVNTVDRAITLYEALAGAIDAGKVEGPLWLLHARFLPADRKRIEEEIRSHFGPHSDSPGILVCTQVVEAGMNISSDILHTEAAQMSAIVQRAGRCARFPGETGEVRIYPLDDSAGQPWLPYRQDDVAATVQLLTGFERRRLSPSELTDLVEHAHQVQDEVKIREGSFRRSQEIQQRLRAIAINRTPTAVSDLIRRDDGQTIRVIVASEPGRVSPYAVEGFALRRWSLVRVFDMGVPAPFAWTWTPEAEDEWAPMVESAELASAFAVCLHPAVVAYASTSGLRLERSGAFVSPTRESRARFRSGPIHVETWVEHAERVGAEAEQRVMRAGGVMHHGWSQAPWELSSEVVGLAARIAGLLHDLGKLQVGWQQWAELAQSSCRPDFRYEAPLAHTDFNQDDPADRERERNLPGKSRPAHAAASVFYGARPTGVALSTMIAEGSVGNLSPVYAACLGAVLAHHGGWLAGRHGQELGIQPLVEAATSVVAEAMRLSRTDVNLSPPVPVETARACMAEWLSLAAGADSWDTWWPLMAYLTRVLRLADQRATSTYGGEPGWQ